MITVTLAGKVLQPTSVGWSLGLDESNPTEAQVTLDSKELDFVNENKGQDLQISVGNYTLTFVLTGVSLEYNGMWVMHLEGSGARWLMDRVPKNILRSDISFEQLAKSLGEDTNVTINSDIRIDTRYKTIVQSGQTDYFHLKQEANRHGLDVVDLGKTLNLQPPPKPLPSASYTALIDTAISFSYQDLAHTKDSGVGAEPTLASSATVKRTSLDMRSGQIKQPLKTLKSTSGKLNIVTLGRQLQSEGYRVGEHPSFGGVCGGCHRGRGHYEGRAIDVNVGYGDPPGERARLDALNARVKGLGYLVLWRVDGHFNHMHIEVPTNRSTHNAGVGRIAPKIDQDAVDSLLDTSKHKEYKGLLATIVVENDVATLKLQPGQVVVTKCKSIQLLNRTWLISGIQFSYEETLITTINLQAPQKDLNADEGDIE